MFDLPYTELQAQQAEICRRLRAQRFYEDTHPAQFKQPPGVPPDRLRVDPATGAVGIGTQPTQDQGE